MSSIERRAFPRVRRTLHTLSVCLSVACVGLRTQDVLPYVSDFCRCMFTRMACVGVSGMGYHVRHEMVRDHVCGVFMQKCVCSRLYSYGVYGNACDVCSRV